MVLPTVLAPKPFDAVKRIVTAARFGRPLDLFALRPDFENESGNPYKLVLDCHFVNIGLVAEFDYTCENRIRWMGRTLKPFAAAFYVIYRNKVSKLFSSQSTRGSITGM